MLLLRRKCYFLFFLIALGKINQVQAEALLYWPEKTGAVEYLGEIAATKDFKTPLIKFSTQDNEYSLTQKIAEGDYYFRIRYVDQFKRISSFSNVARVKVKILPNEKNLLIDKISAFPEKFKKAKYSISLIPSLTASKINSRNADEFIPFAGGFTGNIKVKEFIHSFGVYYFSFQKNSAGYLGYIDYRLNYLMDNFYYGPSAEVMNYNLVYKEKAEVSGGLLTAGAHIGWLSSNSLPWSISLEANSAYDLKGYLVKSDVSKAVLNAKDFNLSLGLKYRLLNYNSSDSYRFSSLGLHITLEKF